MAGRGRRKETGSLGLRTRPKKRATRFWPRRCPMADHPQLSEWNEYLHEIIAAPDKDVVLVGHSLGVIAALRYLESLEAGKLIGGAILVAGFSENVLVGMGALDNFFETPLDFDRAKKAAGRFVVIHSDNDPYVPLENGEILRDRLGAEFILIENGGHLNTGTGNFEFPLVFEKIRGILNR